MAPIVTIGLKLLGLACNRRCKGSGFMVSLYLWGVSLGDDEQRRTVAGGGGGGYTLNPKPW